MITIKDIVYCNQYFPKNRFKEKGLSDIEIDVVYLAWYRNNLHQKIKYLRCVNSIINNPFTSKYKHLRYEKQEKLEFIEEYGSDASKEVVKLIKTAKKLFHHVNNLYSNSKKLLAKEKNKEKGTNHLSVSDGYVTSLGYETYCNSWWL